MAAVEVFADVACPFAHAGLVAFVDRRRTLGLEGLPLLVRAWPLELVNDRPLSAEATRAHGQDLKEQAFPGLFGALGDFVMPSTSLPALDLAAAAYRLGPAVGERVSLALRHALFEEGRDISSADVLEDLAERHGVSPSGDDRESVLADWRTGQGRDVQGSPHFFAGDGDWFCPSVRVSPLEGDHVSVVRRAGALDALLRAGAP